LDRLDFGVEREIERRNHKVSLISSSVVPVGTTDVLLVERETVRGDPGYVTRKDAVTISPVHRTSLAAA